MRYQVLSLILLGVPLFAQDPYTLEARRLSRLASKRAKVEVIAKALKEIDRQLPKHFPNGEFNRIDIIALILGESGWNHKDTGSAANEAGLMQVRPEYFQKHVNPYYVSENIKMGLRVLKGKYALAKRIKGPLTRKQTAIVAYNGYVVRNGHPDTRYLKWFRNNRAKVCRVLDYKKVPVKYAKRREIRTIRKSRTVQNAELARQFELEAARKQLMNDVYGGQS